MKITDPFSIAECMELVYSARRICKSRGHRWLERDTLGLFEYGEKDGVAYARYLPHDHQRLDHNLVKYLEIRGGSLAWYGAIKEMIQ